MLADPPWNDYYGPGSPLDLRDDLARGVARTGRVGNAVSELLEGPDIVSFGVRWMAEHFG